MDILSDSEIDKIVSQSLLIRKYNDQLDRESAYEILGGKMDRAREEDQREQMQRQWETGKTTSRRKEKTLWDNTTTRQIGRTVARELTRGLLGVLGVKTTTRRRTTRKTFPW